MITRITGDHSGSNAKMQAMGVQVVASQQARDHMGTQSARLPNVTFNGHASLFSGKRVDLHHFGRAHKTETRWCFPAQRVLLAGDSSRWAPSAADRGLSRRRQRKGRAVSWIAC